MRRVLQTLILWFTCVLPAVAADRPNILFLIS